METRDIDGTWTDKWDKGKDTRLSTSVRKFRVTFSIDVLSSADLGG